MTCTAGPERWALVTAMVLAGPDLIVQQECDCGMLAEPHIRGMC